MELKARKKQTSRGFVFWSALAAVGACVSLAEPAAAGPVELSIGFSYNRSNYSESNFSWTRRWGASVGYYLTELSQIEVAFQDVWDRTLITGWEDTTFHDQIFSTNWIQNFLGKTYAVQPYAKVGIGQLNREANGSYGYGASPPARLDSLTGIVGAGVKVYLTRNFALRTEGTSYLTGGRISSYQDNVHFTLGGSFFF